MAVALDTPTMQVGIVATIAGAADVERLKIDDAVIEATAFVEGTKVAPDVWGGGQLNRFV